MSQKPLNPDETSISVFLREKFSLHGIKALLIAIVTLLITTYHLYTGYFQAPQATVHRMTHLSLVLILGFLTLSLNGETWRSNKKSWLKVIDVLLILAIVWVFIYTVVDVDAFLSRVGTPTTLDIVTGIILTLIVLEACRRFVGWTMVIVCSFFIVHAFYANYFPGIFYGAPAQLKTMIVAIFQRGEGIVGLPIAIMADYVVLFIIFGALLEKTGAGKFFMDIALALTGRQVGGPAKAATVSSAIMGTISGSAIANVVTTGNITIPLMKKIGYKPQFAGAVEAAASTGGQIMPPVMGAVAFIMAEYMGVPYIEVVKAAIIPAILYFVAIFIAVHLEAKKLNLPILPKSIIPNLWKVLKSDGHLLAPIIVIIVVLFMGYTIQRAAFIGIVSIILFSSLKKSTRLTPMKLIEALEQSGRSLVTVTVSCAAAGIIIAAVSVSGLTWRFSSMIVSLSDGMLLPALLITAVAAILMGMGISTSAVYITLAALVIPSIVSLGVEEMAAHLFAFYFAIIGFITPPVAIVAFAAAGVAKSKPMLTAALASKIALPSFFIPFIFVYNPELIMIGDPVRILISSITAILGVLALSSSVFGYMQVKTNLIERLILFISSIMLIMPNILWSMIGLVLLIGIFLLQKRKEKFATVNEIEATIDDNSLDFSLFSQESHLDSEFTQSKLQTRLLVACLSFLGILVFAGRGLLHLQHFTLFFIFMFILVTALIGIISILYKKSLKNLEEVNILNNTPDVNN